MSRPLLIALEHKGLPILIIDKEGSIGLGLYSHLKEQLQTVLVGGREPKTSDNLVFLPFTKDIPKIPDDTYSHIFYIVDSEKEFERITPSLLEKAKQDGAKVFVITKKENLPQGVIEKLSTEYIKTTIIFLGDLFDNPFWRKNQGSIDKFFYAAKTRKSIVLSHMGLKKLFPTTFDDALLELLRLSFGPRSSPRVFYLHMQHPVTELGLAHIIQKIDPLVKIDFEKNESSLEDPDEKEWEGDFLFSQNYPIFEKLHKSFTNYTGVGLYEEKKTFPLQEDKEIKEEIIEEKMFRTKFPFGVTIFVIVFFLIILIFLPTLVVGIGGFVGQNSLRSVLGDIQKGDVKKTNNDLLVAQKSLSVAKQAMPLLNWETKLVGRESIVMPIGSAIDFGQEAAADVADIISISNSMQQIIQGKNNFSKDQFFEGLGALKHLVIVAQKSSSNGLIAAATKTNIVKTLGESSFFINIIDSLPQVLGIEKKQTYLVLFQNNAELRPGGGFIGSYGLLTFDRGKITNFSIHDVYDADGQLKGHVEPPFAIRRYLPQVHMYLRDSNFDTDYIKNAFLAAFLYQQETGDQVDGVIGIDLSFVREVIGSVGSIYVPSYNETVTKDNFFTLAENHAEKNFFPGSSQKKDFLQSVFSSLQEKVMSGKNVSFINLLQGVIVGIKQKHIIFAFSDTKRQDLFTANGLSSSMWDNRKTGVNTLNDFVGVNEANLSINKVNYFIKRSLKQQVAISDSGEVTGQLNLTFTNTSTGEWPGGMYNSYVRFLLPKDAVITKILINGKEQKIVPAITNPQIYEAKNFVAPAGLEVEKVDEAGKALFGFMVHVPSQATQTIFVFYSLTTKVLVSTPTLGYSLWFFKQPGTDEYPFSFSLTYPSTYKVLEKSDPLKEQDGYLFYEDNVQTDVYLNVLFTKK